MRRSSRFERPPATRRGFRAAASTARARRGFGRAISAARYGFRRAAASASRNSLWVGSIARRRGSLRGSLSSPQLPPPSRCGRASESAARLTGRDAAASEGIRRAAHHCPCPPASYSPVRAIPRPGRRPRFHRDTDSDMRVTVTVIRAQARDRNSISLPSSQ
jgi:hypothetical protein